MKCVRVLNEPTPGLGEFRRAEGDNATWSKFRTRNRGALRRELQDALTRNQHGLCAYCEIEIDQPSRPGRSRRQIEHVIPRSGGEHGDKKALEITNMVACCVGGTESLVGDEGDANEGRFLEPIRDNMSCGQAKGDRYDAAFVDPRTLPALPSLTKVGDDGSIETDEIACQVAGFSPDHVTLTLAILNLNAKRLRLARQKWRDDLVERSRGIDDPDKLSAWIRVALTPDADGQLLRFFTTTRSYFAPLSDRVLGERPEAWI